MRGKGQTQSAALSTRQGAALLGLIPVDRGMATFQEFQELVKLARMRPDLHWQENEKMSNARNAHYTDTAKELKEGLLGDFNFLEVDIRSKGKLAIVGHDRDSFTFSLNEWLAIAASSGRGLKFDFKDPRAIEDTLEKISRYQIADHRLMFNVICGDWDKAKADASTEQIQAIRARHPNSFINITPGSVPYTDETLDKVIHASQWSANTKKTMFPLQVEYITPEVIEKLKPHGLIGAWNIPLLYNPSDIQKDRERLQRMGVDGMIDIRKYTNLPSLFPYRLSPSLANIALRLAKEWENLRRLDN